MRINRLITTYCLSILCLVSCVFSAGCFGLPPDPESYRDVQFVGSQIGFVQGPGGYLLKTLDGGQTWSALDKRSDKRGGLVYFVDSEYGWRLFAFEVLRTTDGGLTWQQTLRATARNQSFNNLYFLDRLNGWILGWGEIWHTSDGGTTWEQQAKEINLPELYDVQFINSQCGWCVGRVGTVFRTCDGGHTWEKSGVGAKYDLTAVRFVSESIGWAVGGAIFHSSDGGKTWSAQATLDSPDPTWEWDLHFINERTGWIVGTNGLVLHTSDGGKNWIRQESGTKMHLIGVWFINENTGWVVGGWQEGDRYEDEMGKPREGWFEGIILRTVNGGQTWERVEPPVKRRKWF